ncbi:aminotransferase class V-fold PLP-dependent enzyme [Lysobacter sp. TY2-98]|uniref:aminotransferase class V-fold PLP-dependent enzyme n=1 Tax=Lysobacter sp. TY2-98 TaxID=2290922 RepID=UPI000E205B35|nr:aminotransferase class V-fold PLP-dependent enzyme [Lysobacter sp. TY2-98]AXK73280.1 aminotransferase class V-fold PLP-dependent enzyme [Lysobacter sp. TY2-98]
MSLPPDVRAAFLIPEGAIYLDTASNAPRTRGVDAALQRAWAEQAAPWRLSFADWEADIEHVRAQMSRLFRVDGVADPDAVAIVPSVAHAMSTIAAGWPLRAGDVVGIVDGEFPSALLPWQARCAAVGARVHAVARENATQGFLDLIEHATPSVLVLSNAHWRDGRLLDLDRVAMGAQARGVPVVLDLSQSLGVLPCDVERWRPAFAMSVGYKWLLGHKGHCAFWVSPEWRERLVPLEQHWQGRAPALAWRFDSAHAPPYRPGARRFDGGEIADPLRLAIAGAGLHDVLAWTPSAISAGLGALLDRLKRHLAEAGLAAWYVEPSSPHLLGLAPPAGRVDAVRAALASAGVACIERDRVFRLAPHLHIGEADIDRVADAIIGAH